VNNSWAREEFGEIELGDKRLRERLITISEQFMKNPDKNVSRAMENWNDTKSAYRFFDNPNVSDKVIMDAHQKKSLERIVASQKQTILCVQDTTEASYAHHPGLTLGHGRHWNGNAMLIHSMLGVSEEGIPFGLIHQDIWYRTEWKTSEKRFEKPIEEKESYKWIKGFQAGNSLKENLPDVQVVVIGDRESDIYDLFLTAHKTPESRRAEILVRSSWNRGLENSEFGGIQDHLKNSDLQGKYSVSIDSRKHENKVAILEIRYSKLHVLPPQNRKEELPILELYGVYCVEKSPPEGVTPISWFLITTLPVLNLESAIEKIKWYSKRWIVERFFRVLKTGCAIEDRQFREPKRIQTCLGLDCIVAWRILFLTMIGREVPELPASVLFEEQEWKALHAYTYRTKIPPEKEPTLGELTLLIAKLGGFLARKGDGPPGELSLWYGFLRLADIVSTWEIFNT